MTKREMVRSSAAKTGPHRRLSRYLLGTMREHKGPDGKRSFRGRIAGVQYLLVPAGATRSSAATGAKWSLYVETIGPDRRLPGQSGSKPKEPRGKPTSR
jgi:hypothetical protein